MDQIVRGVLAMPVWDGIGLTLVREDQGWRFGAWHRDDFSERELPRPPSEADRQRHFDNADAAAAYFKQQYGPPPG